MWAAKYHLLGGMFIIQGMVGDLQIVGTLDGSFTPQPSTTEQMLNIIISHYHFTLGLAFVFGVRPSFAFSSFFRIPGF